MKVLIIHNKYGKHSGEESVVYFQSTLLQEKGHKVITYFRDSSEIDEMLLGKIRAFFTSFFNLKSFIDLRRILKKEKPDIVHVHNLYPLISPSILPFIKRFKVPIVMTVHNYRLLCPNGLFFTQGKICEKCTSKKKELNAIMNNCENSIFKSFGYALRNFMARKFKYYSKNIDFFLCLTNFQKNKLIAKSFDEDKVKVINNVCDIDTIKNSISKEKDYIGYVGRISKEKGIDTLINLAEKMPNVKFKLAGVVSPDFDKSKLQKSNIILEGFLNHTQLLHFYRNAKFLIFPSIWYETFGLTLVEAMSQNCAIIASDIGGVPEIVENNRTGLLFKSGDVEDLFQKTTFLSNNPKLVEKMGINGRLKVEKQYRTQRYYNELMAAYLNTSK